MDTSATSSALVSPLDIPPAVSSRSRATGGLSSPGSLLSVNKDTSPAHKKRKLSLSPTSGEPVSTPTTVQSHARALVAIPTPRTPSPCLHPDSNPSRSFFSPSFFSSSPVSVSSAEGEVEALLASSLPTSPLSNTRLSESTPLSECPSTPVVGEIAFPSPARIYGQFVSTISRLEQKVSDEPESRDVQRVPLRGDAKLPTPSAPRPILLGPGDCLPGPNSDNRGTGVFSRFDPSSRSSPGTTSLPPPADIPPRPRTPPHSGPGGGSKPSTPRPARPPRPTAEDYGAFTSFYAPADNISADVRGVYKADLHGPVSRVVPIPPRVRTPPGSPSGPSGRGSRPGTPAPGRPVRPSSSCITVDSPRSDVDVPAPKRKPGYQTERAPNDSPADVPPPSTHPHIPPASGEGGRSQQKTPNLVKAGGLDNDTLVLTSRQLGAKTKGGAAKRKAQGKKAIKSTKKRSREPKNTTASSPVISTVVKLEDVESRAPVSHWSEVVWTPGEVLKLAEDEDDQPLAIVLARRKGFGVGAASTSVKPALVKDTTPSMSTAGRQKATTSKARGDARGKVKTEASTAAAVKTEPIESTAIQVTAAKQYDRKAKASKQIKKQKNVKVKAEQATVAPSSTTAPVQKERKARAKKAPRGANTNPTPAKEPTESGRSSQKQGPEAGAVGPDNTLRTLEAELSKQDEITNPSSSSTTNATTTIQFRVSFTRTRTCSFPRQHVKYEGRMHPPRTFTYLPEHLWALGTDRSFGWEADGFEYMELSALPWLAGVAQGRVAAQTRTQHAQEITDPAGGMDASAQGSVLLPGGSEGMTEEEDVRVQLYVNGPLPTSFLDTLGRMMCVRRESAESEFVSTLHAVPPPSAEESR
ncbi:hypothetical protein C8Q73DRAFT_840652 [Cubamyces lactineus]|nr:hypothetical protein C8Q73DRAFT_840652 [Cubamyces lactineus]